MTEKNYLKITYNQVDECTKGALGRNGRNTIFNKRNYLVHNESPIFQVFVYIADLRGKSNAIANQNLKSVLEN